MYALYTPIYTQILNQLSLCELNSYWWGLRSPLVLYNFFTEEQFDCQHMLHSLHFEFYRQ